MSDIPAPVVDKSEFNAVYKRSRRRGGFEIKMDILNTIQYESLPTKIMYITRLSWKALQKELTELEGKGLIVRIWNRNDDNARVKFVYKLTENGLKAIQVFKEMPL